MVGHPPQNIHWVLAMSMLPHFDIMAKRGVRNVLGILIVSTWALVAADSQARAHTFMREVHQMPNYSMVWLGARAMGLVRDNDWGGLVEL